MPIGTRLLLVFSLATAVAGCNRCSTARSNDEPRSVHDVSGKIETGDLPALKEQGTLRILTPPGHPWKSLPRGATAVENQVSLAKGFARSLGLEPVLVFAPRSENLLPLLKEGRADIVVANLTVTEERKESFDFSVPIASAKEMVVGTEKTAPAGSCPESLKDKNLTVRKSSTYWETLQNLKEDHPEIKVSTASETLSTEALLGQVARGDMPLTVADSNMLRRVETYLPELKSVCSLTKGRPIAWAVRQDSPKLKHALNRYLNRTLLTRGEEIPLGGDLDEIKERGVLRVVTRNAPTSYFLWRGQLMGFEYEFTKAFAEQHGLRLEVLVPPSHDKILEWLEKGRADLAAAGLSPTPERRANKAFAWSNPYRYVTEVVVGRADGKKLNDLTDLAERTLVVRKSSSYWSHLRTLQDKGALFQLKKAPESTTTEELISKVAAGEYDLTVADSHIVETELKWRSDIQQMFVIGDPSSHAWAVRSESEKLLEEINTFIQKEYRGLRYNLLHKKYLGNTRNVRKHVEQRVAKTGKLSPYDNIVQRYADRYDFDWRLIVSQMFQESRFRHEARSFAGAVGLMQVLPRTARDLGFKTLKSPETGIHAGVKYMDWVRDRFAEQHLPADSRMWFTLAAYNAGYGHVYDARRVAHQEGLDPDKWFGHTEKAIRLLSKQEYARRARYGYCRGYEPFHYVRNIRQRYKSYVALLERRSPDEQKL